MSEWISVEERLPPDDGGVLAALSSNATTLAEYRKGRWASLITCRYIEPTHWMPIPQLGQDPYEVHRGYLSFDSEPKYPLRTRIHELEKQMESLVGKVAEQELSLAHHIGHHVAWALAIEGRLNALERRALNHTHRISHDPAICALKNTSRPEDD